MGNEKYLNYYVEVLTGTMTDAVIRNISLQANARVTEDVINEQAEQIKQLQTQLNNEKHGSEGKVNGYLDTISKLNNQLDELNRMRGEYENNKHQVSHVDTFRNELVKERDEHQKTRISYEDKIKELNNQIEYLQLTPAKRKKIDEANNKITEVPSLFEAADVSTDVIKDGGSF